MKVQLISAAICLLGFAACNNASKSPKELSSAEILEQVGKAPGMNAGNGTFTVQTPEGWSRKDTVISRVEYTFMMAPVQQGSAFQANVNVITQELKSGSSLDKYMEATQQEMQNYFDSYKKLEDGERTVTDVKAKWLKCGYVHRETGTKLNILVTVLVKNNIAYAITLTTLADDLEKYTPALEEILNTFKAK
ncbi:DcrB-related protein [Chitinophaga sp. 22321]|uniref:DcrB-related protein n=1 Tax=Chitinophaga hostae TaxID=2831022 RepID=A0ABS5J2Y0_9BACT|nr:DcrB-related protein [Chitinophaga hostae]MBS0029584.1 DcrB-related protein [Chitinophaga hostae]